MIRAALGGLLLLALVLGGGVVYLTTLPSVADARLRVRRILVVHREPAGSLPAPARLAAAVVSVEDEHFYDNFAVNSLTGLGRAAVAALQTSQDPGGSTIDQQLAKLLYGRGSGIGAVLQEIGLGVKLSFSYSKRQILAMYLNSVYYGNGYWGVAAAARGYFGTAPDRLTWGEAAMLAGLPQAPSAYDPLVHYALARARQRHVLSQLVVNHYLSAAQARAAFAEHLPLR